MTQNGARDGWRVVWGSQGRGIRITEERGGKSRGGEFNGDNGKGDKGKKEVGDWGR